ncbi:hypothetical protein MMG00_02415 [Ignatzschineria rhizosphaerae]|uniref:DUF2681 domain-containing protein n=1 Tax=Ignatzschineria rhizosphaerae TaxID=2923279 RepID=A0ABY3X1H3_9GAMM|nr:hypothetical protein [Ignatzschineria rhizosphaerae]UNM96728.1 hypothetical protein MMG00_02415 [Ignatzschineria rhizosphaerae]
MKKWLSSLAFALSVVFLWLFKREQSKREAVEKELEASQLENSAAKVNEKALEIKRDVKNNNIRDPSDRVERMRRKGHLRD